MIVGPLGDTLAGPLWDQEGLLPVTIDGIHGESIGTWAL